MITRWAKVKLLLGALLASAMPVWAQPEAPAREPLAGSGIVHFAEVEFLRANTERWLRLPVGAEFVVGPGDVLRTSTRGRVRIRLGDVAEVLLLPDSEWRLQGFERAGTQAVMLHADVDGRMVQRSLAEIQDFQLRVGEVILDQAATHFLVEAQPEQPVFLMVAEGAARLRRSGVERIVSAGEGLRVRPEDVSEAIALDGPLRPATLVGLLDGCEGVVDAGPIDNSVNVRVGPGEGFIRLGPIPNGTTVPLLGISSSRARYLVPYLNGYGWVLARSIQTSCSSLSQASDVVYSVQSIVNVLSSELNDIRPFYGTPTEDSWFYIYE